MFSVAGMTVKTSVVLCICICMSVILSNVGCDNREDEKLADDADTGVALVAIGTEDDNADASVEDESVDFMKDATGIFEPSDEWKKVEPGQVIPKGLHVRLNLETGEKEAKLMSDKDDSSSHQSAEEVRVKQMKLAMEEAQQELNVESSELHDDLKYWKHADKEGMMNMKNSYFTHDELKQALKKFKAQRDDVQHPVSKESGSDGQFRSIDEIRREFESLNVDMKTDLEILNEILLRYRRTEDLSPQERLAILSDLEYYLHQIDNAKNFADMGGLQLVISDLNSTDRDVRNEAALVLSSAVQSNPAVQIAAVEAGALQQLIRLLSIESCVTFRSRLLAALSSLVRHFPFAQRKFLELGGLQTLSQLLARQSYHSQKLSIKAITLVSDLLMERTSLKADKKRRDPQHEERILQYSQVPLLESVVDHGWCQLVPRLLAVSEHDAREKVLGTMWSLREPCRPEFAGHVPLLEALHDEYARLAEVETHHDGASPSDEPQYFTELLRTVDHIISHVSVAKDEL